jgi:hypothetical protein
MKRPLLPSSHRTVTCGKLKAWATRGSDSRRSGTLRIAGRCLVGGELILRGVAADQARRNSKREGT